MKQQLDHGQKNYGWNSTLPTMAISYIYPNILKLLPEGRKLNLLDSGCGNGYITGKLSEIGHSVIGIDLSTDGIQLAKNKYPNVRFEIRSVYEDLFDLAKNVDVVISSEVIEHLYYPNRFLENMYNVLKPGGYLIVTTPYHGWLKNILISIFGKWDKHHTVDWEGGHIKFFSEKSLSKLLIENGFGNIAFKNAGRVPYLWKSMVCRAQKVS